MHTSIVCVLPISPRLLAPPLCILGCRDSFKMTKIFGLAVRLEVEPCGLVRQLPGYRSLVTLDFHSNVPLSSEGLGWSPGRDDFVGSVGDNGILH